MAKSPGVRAALTVIVGSLTALAWRGNPRFGLALVALALAPLVVAGRIDVRTRRLPNRLLGLACLPAGAAAVLASGSTSVAAVESLLGVALTAGPLLAVHLINPSGMGFGDVKLGMVLGLIRGMPFEGTAYLWPDPEGITSELVMLATGLATELAGRCLVRGDLDGVVWATGQGLRVLPEHEGLIALRLRARASTGDLAGVRQEWASYERVLADDWGGGEPAPELVELRRELLTR